jgi:dTDP-4-dehydrorhamnose 3,5-epimerase
VKLSETDLAGAFIVDIDRREDNRGSFSRILCAEQFAASGLSSTVAQANISYNRKRGTLRGLHFQYPPVAEDKYVRCIRGEVLDVIVDLRPESPTYLMHVAVNLSAENGRGLYVPKRFAHGFITLTDDTELLYFISNSHTPGAEGGIRYDDPVIGVKWPVVDVIAARDVAWAPLAEREPAIRMSMAACG